MMIIFDNFNLDFSFFENNMNLDLTSACMELDIRRVVTVLNTLKLARV